MQANNEPVESRVNFVMELKEQKRKQASSPVSKHISQTHKLTKGPRQLTVFSNVIVHSTCSEFVSGFLLRKRPLRQPLCKSKTFDLRSENNFDEKRNRCLEAQSKEIDLPNREAAESTSAARKAGSKQVHGTSLKRNGGGCGNTKGGSNTNLVTYRETYVTWHQQYHCDASTQDTEKCRVVCGSPTPPLPQHPSCLLTHSNSFMSHQTR